MNKSLRYLNLSLELYLFQHFDWDLTNQVLFLYILPTHHMNLRAGLDIDILWCRTDIYSCKLSATVSLMLDNQFLVPSLCKLNHINVCFVQISKKITCKQLIPLSESHVFFDVILGVLGCLINFNPTYRFLLRQPIIPDSLSVFCDYGGINYLGSLYSNWNSQQE